MKKHKALHVFTDIILSSWIKKADDQSPAFRTFYTIQTQLDP
ncbi:hypothetical protein A33Q_2589 [Indibacter alkaliphilus LW1]|uniref:Uncharacterized protein n=1 Tax=Indibacter alkaliphilus (strain CCUG 57479 / KCTC 22604 / LW1) TaxID=1189612 RepID=S2DV93_INDAL|nr:hypothetical protein A33Q_2589 [Indibacter alkaliphilus LW1]